MRSASFVLLAFVLLLGGCSKPSEDISQTNFPQHLQTQVELARAKAGKTGNVRFLHFNKDKTKLTGVEIEFADGSTEYEYYREDGTLRELQGYYPLAENAKDRKPKRSVLYDKDGKSVLFERSMRVDGTAETYKRSRPDGGSETETFYADGKTVKQRKVVNTYNDLVLEENFRSNGKLEKQTRKLNYYEFEDTEYREDGTRSSATVRSTSRWAPVDRVDFADDGIMIEMKTHYTSYNIEVQYFRKDGTLAERRSFSSYGGATITVYGTDGKAQFKQEWSSKTSYPSDPTDMSEYTLRRIEEMKDGSTVREIQLYDDGKTVKQVRIPDGTNYYSGKYRYFRPDGTLEKEEVKEDYSTVKETKEFKPEENIKETIPEEFFRLSPRKKPFKLAQMPEEQPYNYYGEGYPYGDGCGCGEPGCQGGCPGSCPCGDSCPSGHQWDD